MHFYANIFEIITKMAEIGDFVYRMVKFEAIYAEMYRKSTN